MVCSTRPGRLPPVGSGLPAMHAPARFAPELSQARQDRPRPFGRTAGPRRLSGPFLPLGRADNSQASGLYVLDQYYL